MRIALLRPGTMHNQVVIVELSDVVKQIPSISASLNWNRDVRFWHKADINDWRMNVRYWG
jgi:hypothetical protein